MKFTKIIYITRKYTTKCIKYKFLKNGVNMYST